MVEVDSRHVKSSGQRLGKPPAPVQPCGAQPSPSPAQPSKQAHPALPPDLPTHGHPDYITQEQTATYDMRASVCPGRVSASGVHGSAFGTSAERACCTARMRAHLSRLFRGKWGAQQARSWATGGAAAVNVG